MALSDYVQLATMFGLIITAFFTIINYLHSQRVLDEHRLSEKRQILIARLNEFYGPLLTYLSVIDSLHRLLFIGKPPEFRTLTYLLNPEQEYQTPSGRSKVVLSDSDRMLVEQILELEDKTEQHIIKNCGLVEDSRLAFNYVPDPTETDIDPKVFENLGLLSILVSHFRVLRMAYERKISADVKRYESYVYPRELNGILRANIKDLQSQLRELGGLVPGSADHVAQR
jgi:hypothetical protein